MCSTRPVRTRSADGKISSMRPCAMDIDKLVYCSVAYPYISFLGRLPSPSLLNRYVAWLTLAVACTVHQGRGIHIRVQLELHDTSGK